jgi:CheY-like chemotaxis protein
MHQPARILIVDDNEANRDILKTRLAVHGYDLLEAGDGEQALAAAKEHSPDLVLLDGMVVNLAARLCSEAKDGQILLDSRVRAAVECLHVDHSRDREGSSSPT